MLHRVLLKVCNEVIKDAWIIDEDAVDHTQRAFTNYSNRGADMSSIARACCSNTLVLLSILHSFESEEFNRKIAGFEENDDIKQW